MSKKLSGVFVCENLEISNLIGCIFSSAPASPLKKKQIYCLSSLAALLGTATTRNKRQFVTKYNSQNCEKTLYNADGHYIARLRICHCSDFRYVSNGIFVLGVGFFFLHKNFDFLTSHF